MKLCLKSSVIELVAATTSSTGSKLSVMTCINSHILAPPISFHTALLLFSHYTYITLSSYIYIHNKYYNIILSTMETKTMLVL